MDTTRSGFFLHRFGVAFCAYVLSGPKFDILKEKQMYRINNFLNICSFYILRQILTLKEI